MREPDLVTPSGKHFFSIISWFLDFSFGVYSLGCIPLHTCWLYYSFYFIIIWQTLCFFFPMKRLKTIPDPIHFHTWYLTLAFLHWTQKTQPFSHHHTTFALFQLHPPTRIRHQTSKSSNKSISFSREVRKSKQIFLILQKPIKFIYFECFFGTVACFLRKKTQFNLHNTPKKCESKTPCFKNEIHNTNKEIKTHNLVWEYLCNDQRQILQFGKAFENSGEFIKVEGPHCCSKS